MTTFFLPLHAPELQRAFAALPGGPSALDEASGAVWEYHGTELLDGAWEHCFLHRHHPGMGSGRIVMWVAADAAWSPFGQPLTLIPRLGALVASLPAEAASSRSVDPTRGQAHAWAS